jgi:hypothetical protein
MIPMLQTKPSAPQSQQTSMTSESNANDDSQLSDHLEWNGLQVPINSTIGAINQLEADARQEWGDVTSVVTSPPDPSDQQEQQSHEQDSSQAR